MEPSYLKAYERGVLRQRIQEALDRLDSCMLCPRQCGVNRLEGEEGICRTGRKVRVASYNAHFGEEAPLVGKYGSGTIFISSCNLLCRFCQNYEISHLREGFEVEPEQLAAMMIQLAQRGCHNINFVTPSHVVPQILEALPIAIEQGLRVPLVYNSSGYDAVETLKLLEGIFDIYMPDFKFWDKKWAERYCDAPDYPEAARMALKEMYRQVGDLELNEEGIAVKGLLVRHLVMPGGIAGTLKVAEFISKEISPNTYINVMDQYRPCGEVHGDDIIGRRLTASEFRKAVEATKAAGLHRLDPRDRVRLIFTF
ncbi:MAG TPA: radical SAM protein [Desulfobacterales bacterium]|nr:radical SAM protein [Desulfobacterales bacterium]